MTDGVTDVAMDSQEKLESLVSHYHELAELAGSLAHEIKNPLAVIRMNMDLLAEDFADVHRIEGNTRKSIPNLLLLGYLVRVVEDRVLEDDGEA